MWTEQLQEYVRLPGYAIREFHHTRKDEQDDRSASYAVRDGDSASH